MTLDEKILYLQKAHAPFGKRVIRDVDSHGNDFCELIYPNEKNPRFPITLSVSDDGCIISVGQIPNVTGKVPITVEQASDAIDDIISDKIIFVLGYHGEDDVGEGKPYLTEIFALTGNDDDMQEDYDRFIEKISTPIKGLKRKLTRLKGRFIITNFSGSIDQTIER
jgi:hypothetical protein